MSKNLYIGFGAGIKLLSEDWYIKEMGPHMKKRAFRDFCKAIRVPLIKIGPITYVEMNSFLIALKAITRIGRPDFYVYTNKNDYEDGNTSNLDPTYVAENLEPILCELLVARTLSGGSLTAETKTAARVAAERMARAGIAELPLDAQEEYTRKAREMYAPVVQKAHNILSNEQEEHREETE